MIDVILYDTETGQIKQSMRLMGADEAALNCGPGEAWIEGFADALSDRVVDGVVIPRDPAVVEAERIAAAWSALRAERDRRLAACDWTQVADAPVDQVAWGAYRAALRDLPQITTDPLNPVWPVAPGSEET